VAVGVGGLIVGLVLLLLVVFLAIPKLTETGSVKVNVGSRTLALGHAEVKAATIAQDGPIYFQDPSGGELDVYIQHLGGDEIAKGWTAFATRPPGAARECNMKWDRARQLFVACDGTTVPADGGTLPHFAVDVDQDLQLTLNLDPTASTTPPATTAS
jgi:hypothetical protein